MILLFCNSRTVSKIYIMKYCYNLLLLRKNVNDIYLFLNTLKKIIKKKSKNNIVFGMYIIIIIHSIISLFNTTIPFGHC